MNIDDVKTIAVIGAGDMGHGIAEVALIAGYKVYLRDVKQEFVDKGVSRIYQSLDKLAEKGKVDPGHVAKIKNELLKPCLEIKDAVAIADLVIEAIPEIMELKKETFAAMDEAAPPHTLLASNTSTMKITEIAKATKRPEKVLGLHYFNPAVLMRLVEVIRGEGTSEETMEIGFDFVNKNAKVPVRVEKDVPGFIVNRVQAPSGVLLNCWLDEGIIEPMELDATMRKLGMPMGPYEVMDYAGLDIAIGGANYFAETVHPDFGPGRVVKETVAAGNLGKKSGKGLFDWSAGRPAIDLEKATGKVDPMDLMVVNINEATKIVAQGACSLQDVDTAIVNGTGNAVGPIALAKNMDPADLADRLDKLADRFGKEIFRPTDMIKSGGYI